MKHYEIQIDSLRHRLADSVVTGQQLLDETGKRSTDQLLIFQLLQNGQMESIRPDEMVDLRKPGIEKFLVFESDRTFFFILNGQKLEWPIALISGRTLKEKAGVDPESQELWLDVRGSEDQLITDQAFVNLEESKETERLFTRPLSQITFFIDQQRFATDRKNLTVRELIVDFAKEDPNLVTLVLRQGNQLDELTDLNQVICLKNEMQFVLYFNTPTSIS
jgi:Multiubiquitin